MINAPNVTPAAIDVFRQAAFRLEASRVPDFKCEAEAHALEHAPREACGVVVDGKYWRCRNIASDPQKNFALNPCDYATASLFGEVEAIVHSHPQGGPASKADLAACQQTRLPWHIYSIPERKWLTINPC